MMMTTMRERFDAKWMPEPMSGCWLWTAPLNWAGYGTFRTGSRSDGTRRLRRAHRVSYEMNVGPIPVGLELDHLCRVRSCVNPAHLEPATRLENIRRGVGPALLGARNRARQLAKTHCPRGHPYAGDNLYVAPDGKRQCRACHRECDRRRYWVERDEHGRRITRSAAE